MSRLSVSLIVVALLAACTSEAPPPAATASATSSSASVAPAPGTIASASAVASGGGASKVEESTDLYEFDYSYPAAAGRIPALKVWLDAERDKARKQLIEEATVGRAEAKESGFEYHTYALGRAWEKVTETPRFLSLSAQIYDYSGGAHPRSGTHAHRLYAVGGDAQPAARLCQRRLCQPPPGA